MNVKIPSDVWNFLKLEVGDRLEFIGHKDGTVTVEKVEDGLQAY